MFASLLLPVLLAAPAQAGKKPKVIDRIAAAQVAELARSAGGAVEQSIDSVGDPVLQVTRGGAVYVVLFYGCNEEGCETLQFRSYWKGTLGRSLEDINKRTQEDWFGRMYIDQDGDLTFEHVVDLRGGVTIGAVEKQLEVYLRKAGKIGGV